ncbi:MAG: class I tRNA ligase family protein, partial [Phycisphaera sp.]|nr:class I tRNA ligase family protein [Phycisphaera sp.]
FSWGIPFPGDEEHVIYVWIDALLNYATALELADDASDLHRHWPAAYHVIGKEILWFHAVIWPAVLMALELPQPACVYAHSFWISEGQKMSKSLGNFIDLPTIERYVDVYGLDAWRWYMVNNGPLGATDADFQAAGFHETYTTDLVNTVGNCASRTTAMLGKYFDGIVPADTGFDFPGWDLAGAAGTAVAKWRAAMADFALDDACEAGIGLLRTVDAFINATEPFKVAKDEARRDELASILARCVEAVRVASVLLWPVIPGRMETLWPALGCDLDPSRGDLEAVAAWGDTLTGATTRKIALFPRVDRATTPAADVVSGAFPPFISPSRFVTSSRAGVSTANCWDAPKDVRATAGSTSTSTATRSSPTWSTVPKRTNPSRTTAMRTRSTATRCRCPTSDSSSNGRPGTISPIV